MRRLLSVPFVIGLTVGAAGTGFSAAMLGSGVFSDVQQGAYYDEAIGEMFDAGVIKGYEDGRFGPNDYVTRGQIAVMFQRFQAFLENGGARVIVDEEEEEEEEEEEDETSSSSKKSSSSSSSAMSFASIGPEGSVHFTIKSFTVNETVGTATISVVRTGGNAGSVTVEYATSNGTATAGSDYTETKGTLSFGNKETSKTFTIPIGDDTTAEGNETVNIVLSNTTGGAVLSAPVEAVLTIVDNETTTGGSTASAASVAHAVMFTANTYAVQENAGSITVTVQRVGGTSPVTVNYSATNGTAIAQDYTSPSGTLSFAQGEVTKTFSITVADEGVVDGNKTVTLLLSGVTGGAVLGTPSSVQLIIVDNETTASGSGSFRFSTGTYTVTEGEAGVISVNRAGGNTGTVSVNYTVTNGTALSGSDYTAVSGTLTFLQGETSKSFLVQTTNDDLGSEGEETANLSLSAPTGGAALLSPSTATLRIGS
ncbi:hypothetical protein A2706_00055 [Candidatus Peribacteria bacterium RIFCSPHIGHO2_01_FULL_51_35]|nr:MAG: hypothetical protein A2706_00055 [Candidatus Peribacteria bacterium RIFCSPHIGHO2_01_FULL_51_35]